MRRILSTSVAVCLAASGFTGLAADGDPLALHDCEANGDDILVVEGEPHEQTMLGAPLFFPLTDTEGDPAEAKAIAVVSDTYAMNFVEGNKGLVTMTITWEQASDIDLDIYDSSGVVVGQGHTFNVDSQTYKEIASWSPKPCETYTAEILNNIGIAQEITITTEVTSKAPRVR